MADGWIELFDVETDEAGVLFVFDRCEPVDYGCDVFLFFEVAFFRNRAVDAVEGLFADFAYLGLRGVDESASRFVCEVWLVIFKCYECVFIGCSVYSVVDPSFIAMSLFSLWIACVVSGSAFSLFIYIYIYIYI